VTTHPIAAANGSAAPLRQLPVETRPTLAPALHRLCALLARQLPGLQSVDTSQIQIVAGQARGSARASIRSLCHPEVPLRVRLQHRHLLYELTLRPRWFRQSSPERRLESLVHELWHIDPDRIGGLAVAHQHLNIARRDVRREVDQLLAVAGTRIDPAAAACLAWHGEVLMPAWLTRPVLTGEPQRRRCYGQRDLFLQPVMMITQ